MDDFIPLLKQADGIVNQRLPLALSALNTMFSFLVSDFKNVVAKASSGPFLDPSQNAKETVSTLSHMCAHVHYLSAQLEQLSRISQNLTGEIIHGLVPWPDSSDAFEMVPLVLSTCRLNMPSY